MTTLASFVPARHRQTAHDSMAGLSLRSLALAMFNSSRTHPSQRFHASDARSGGSSTSQSPPLRDRDLYFSTRRFQISNPPVMRLLTATSENGLISRMTHCEIGCRRTTRFTSPHPDQADKSGVAAIHIGSCRNPDGGSPEYRRRRWQRPSAESRPGNERRS
jgi:hypothetical protein